MLEEMKQKVGLEIKARALNSYFTIQKHLHAFIEEKYHTTDIAFGLIEEDFLDCLQHYSVGKLGHSQGHYRKMALAVKKVCRLDVYKRQPVGTAAPSARIGTIRLIAPPLAVEAKARILRPPLERLAPRMKST